MILLYVIVLLTSCPSSLLDLRKGNSKVWLPGSLFGLRIVEPGKCISNRTLSGAVPVFINFPMGFLLDRRGFVVSFASSLCSLAFLGVVSLSSQNSSLCTFPNRFYVGS